MPVVLRNCEFGRLASPALLDQVRYVSCRRIGGHLPGPVRSTAATWSGDKPVPQLTMSVPADATICSGDIISIRLVAHYAAQPFAGHIRITAMGTEILLLLLSPATDQEIDIDLTMSFAGNAFAQPDRFSVSGPVRVNNTMAATTKHPGGSVDRRTPLTVDLAAWIDKPVASPAGIEVRTARITFREGEGDG
jgi:hypothetical protein